MIEKTVKSGGGTYFAAPERLSEDELRLDIEIVSNNPVMTNRLPFVSPMKLGCIR